MMRAFLTVLRRALSLPGMAMAMILLNGCATYLQADLVTPVPTEYWPTAIAQTLVASGVDLSTPTLTLPATPTMESTETSTLTPSLVAASSATPTITSTSVPPITTTMESITTTMVPITTPIPGQVENPFQITLPPPPEETPPAEIPEANIQIYQLGELSIVTSPIHVSSRLTSHWGKVVRIELHGEDGRLLAREVRVFHDIPWQSARIGKDLEFEINGTAELGRVVISVEDVHGRLIDVNSANLILLSTGQTDLNPYSPLWQKIIIQEPAPQALILGGTLFVSGRVRPNDPEQPLRAMLIAEDGRILGQRIASVDVPIPGDYGTFVAEVPYTVADITPALLVVFESGGQISPISYLESREIILAP